MSSTTSNPIATITNNSGSDLDIYDVFNPTTNSSAPGPLTYTLLATVPNGASAQQVQTSRFASQLQAMVTGNIQALNGNYYQQFPVAVLAVSPFAVSNAFTITSDMQQSMVDSFKFIKYAQANPSSQLATQFRTALLDATSQTDAVNKFFQATGSFKLCTMNTWVAVLAWQAQFTSPWQGTYYLYSLGDSSVDNTSGSPVPALVATLAISSSAATNSAVLTMAGTDNENTPVVMAGDGTMQEQNLGTGNLSVALKPTWLNVAQTSQQNGKTVANYVIGAAFAGTINGLNVVGNLNQLTIPSPSDSSRDANDKNSANAFSLGSLQRLVGMLTSIDILYYKAKSYKQAEMKKKNKVEETATSEADAKAKKSKVEADYQADDVSRLLINSAMAENPVLFVQQGYKEVVQAQVIQNKQDTALQQLKQLEDIIEGGAPSEATMDAYGSLSKASKELQMATDPNASEEARGATLTGVSHILTKTSIMILSELQAGVSQLSQQEEQALKDTQEAIDKVQEQAKAQEENQVNQEEQDSNGVGQEVDDNQFEDPEPIDAPQFQGTV